MEEIRIERYGDGFRVEAGGYPPSVLATATRQDRSVFFYCNMSGGSRSEARAFAQRIIAVADAVEAELKEQLEEYPALLRAIEEQK